MTYENKIKVYSYIDTDTNKKLECINNELKNNYYFLAPSKSKIIRLALRNLLKYDADSIAKMLQEIKKNSHDPKNI